MKISWKKILIELLKAVITIVSAGGGAYTAMHM